MLGVVILHVAAALKHHMVDRDEVLQRMLPFLKKRST
jgi:cytochrome b561